MERKNARAQKIREFGALIINFRFISVYEGFRSLRHIWSTQRKDRSLRRSEQITKMDQQGIKHPFCPIFSNILKNKTVTKNTFDYRFILESELNYFTLEKISLEAQWSIQW